MGRGRSTGMSLVGLHALPPLILVLVVVNLVLALWAFLANLRRRTLPGTFWVVLLVSLVCLIVQVAAGVTLTAGGARPKTSLHFVYGILVAGTGLVQFGIRPGGFLRASIARDPATFREARLLALICLTQAALIMRAYTTGALGR